MAMLRKAVAVLACLLGLSFIVGCNTEQTEHKETAQVEYTLTERQIDLLIKLGLPTNYSELNIEQKNAIAAIERMLSHLETEYGDTFVYLGYVSSTSGETEHLIAYPAEKGEDDAITLYCVYENGSFRYWDNMTEIQAKSAYEDAIRLFAGDYVDVQAVKVFSEIRNVETAYTKEDVLRTAAATSYIFLDEAKCSEEQFVAFAEACAALLQENFHNKASRINLFLTRSDEMYRIRQETYRDVLADDIFTKEIDCSISGDGTITIR